MSRSVARAFTLVELLVVIGIIALLVGILLPALSRARDKSKNVACSARLRNLGQAIVMYANENRNRIPQHYSGAIWMWDVAAPTRDALVKKGGTRQTLYCPFFPEQDVDELWNFNTTPGTEFAVIGYFWLGKRIDMPYPPYTASTFPQLVGRGYIESLKPPKPPTGVAPALAALYPTKSSDTEVVTDATFKQNGRWAAIGGWNGVHVTPHIGRNGEPQGGNVLYMDWHVDWRPFKEMKRRAIYGSPQIEFWY